MPHAHTFEAIVLASYDVGEADRFVILLTRESGRLTARAPGVRRPKSRMGSLLPLTHLSLDLKEGNGTFLVTAIHHPPHHPPPRRMGDFLTGMQGSELLLSLLHDAAPVPTIFDATAAFLATRGRRSLHLLSFTFRLLSLLGVVPEASHTGFFRNLTKEERSFIDASAAGALIPLAPTSQAKLTRLCTQIVEEHATRPLRAPDVAAACGATVGL